MGTTVLQWRRPRPPRWRTGPSFLRDPRGQEVPHPRSRHPPNDLAAVPEGCGGGHGQAGLTREPTGAGRCGLQVPEILTSVRLDGVRGIVVVRDAAEQAEQFIGRRWGDCSASIRRWAFSGDVLVVGGMVPVGGRAVVAGLSGSSTSVVPRARCWAGGQAAAAPGGARVAVNSWS